MNKKETIAKIQKELKNELGYPDVSFLNKLTETNNFHLMMDICMMRDEARMIGLKMGLEVAKDTMKIEGYDFQFPDPESIKIQQDDVEQKDGE